MQKNFCNDELEKPTCDVDGNIVEHAEAVEGRSRFRSQFVVFSILTFRHSARFLACLIEKTEFISLE